MSEQDPSQHQLKARTPTDEELKHGFYLESNEAVAFDIPPGPLHARVPMNIGNGVEVLGKTVAVIEFGGDKTRASGMVINTHDGGPGQRDYIFVLYSPNSPRTVAFGLKPGELWGIGRGFEGQDFLPDTVSGDHGAVGLDENNRLVIENHNPTNYTAARRIL